ncbi:MAG TPA: nucleotidyltransferase family protein [Acidobacteriaceae bacterium]|nr:nucleotidyltransferase family protein [Acidobacteriaceae bacterium]
MEAIVLAGGLGTRLRSRLNGVPKPMAPVAGRPFLEILLDRLADAGFCRTLLSVGYLGSVISDHFGNHWRGMSLDYVTEDSPLGTGGAIRRALAHIKESSAFVLNGDTWLDADYRAMEDLHESSRASLTLALSRVPDVARYGGVELDGNRITGFIEKGRTGPGWINAGVYILSRDFPWPVNLAEKFSFETDVLFPLLPTLRHATFLSQSYFLDIGIPEDLDRAQEELGGRNRRPPTEAENH